MNRLRTIPIWIAGLMLLPLAAQASTFAEIVNNSLVPLGNAIVALLYALAFIFFLIGMVQHFFSHSSEKREQGKYFAIYGLSALVILFVVWGLVRFLISIISSFNT